MQSCLEAQKHQQVEDKAAVTRGCVTGQHEVCAVQWCTRLYTGDSAFFSPCLGWPSPKATTKSLTFLTGAIVCRRAQRAPNANAPPPLPSPSWLRADQTPPPCVPSRLSDVTSVLPDSIRLMACSA